MTWSAASRSGPKRRRWRYPARRSNRRKARAARQHFLGRTRRIERGIADHDAVGIDKLRGGQQRAAVNVRMHLMLTPCGCGEFQMPRKQPETQDQKNGINRGSTGQPDPDTGRAELRPEGQSICGGEPDKPVADRGEQQRQPWIVHAAKSAGRASLDTVRDKKLPPAP